MVLKHSRVETYSVDFETNWVGFCSQGWGSFYNVQLYRFNIERMLRLQMNRNIFPIKKFSFCFNCFLFQLASSTSHFSLLIRECFKTLKLFKSSSSSTLSAWIFSENPILVKRLFASLSTLMFDLSVRQFFIFHLVSCYICIKSLVAAMTQRIAHVSLEWSNTCHRS